MNGLQYDIRGLARKCVVALYVYVAAEALFGIASFVNWMTFTAMRDRGERFFVSDSLTFAELVSIPYLIAMLTCIVMVAFWIHHASTNAAQIAPSEDRITPGWAVGWFFVPLLNLWKPYQAMKQTYNSTSKDAGSLDGPMPGYVLAWWLCWVTTNLVANASMRISGTDVSSLITLEIFNMIAVPFGIAAAILLARLIQDVTQKQETSGAVASVFA